MALPDLLLALLDGGARPRCDLQAEITRLTGQAQPGQVERCLLSLRAGGFVNVHGGRGPSRPLVLTETGRARARCWLTRPAGCRSLEPRDLAVRALLDAWPRGQPGELWRRQEILRRRRLLAAGVLPDTRSDVSARLRLARLRRTLEVEVALLAEIAREDPCGAALRPPRPAVPGSR